MRFVELVSRDGRKVYVNPLLVKQVNDNGDYVRLHLGEECLDVEGPLGRVVALLNRGL